MTILNVDEIEQYGITEQPKEYNSEEELIKWLKYDLLKQALGKGKNPDENNTITITDNEEYDYTLNIGEINGEKIIFNFDININYNLFFMNNNETNYKINFNSIVFNNFVSLKKIKFNNDINIQNSYFNNKFDLFEITFDKNVDFSNSVFNKDNIEYYFYKVTFNRNAFFRSVSIKHKIIFNNMYLENKFNLSIIESYNTHIEFDNIYFQNSNSYLNIFYVDKNIHKIILKNTIIDGKIELRNIEVEEADFKGSVINGGLINPVNFKVHKFANRESALFLKNEAYARNNAIDALEYKAKEVEKHKEDLIKDWKNNKNLKTFGDILSIELSSIYSDNGQNWIKAFIITLLTNLTFFGFYFSIVNNTWHFILSIFIILLLSIKFIKKEIQIYVYLLILIISGIVFGKVPLKIIYDLFIGQSETSNFLYRFFIFLNPTNYDGLSILSGQNYIKQFFSGICYFLGKIAFWYGSVQTVTAFRKFAKGA